MLRFLNFCPLSFPKPVYLNKDVYFITNLSFNCERATYRYQREIILYKDMFFIGEEFGKQDFDRIL